MRNQDNQQFEALIAELICPITQELMVDPVTVESGHTFDRLFIQAWFKTGKNTNPITGLPLKSTVLYPNIAMRNIVQKIPKVKSRIRNQQKNINELENLVKGIERMWGETPKNISQIKQQKNLEQNQSLIDQLKQEKKKVKRLQNQLYQFRIKYRDLQEMVQKKMGSPTKRKLTSFDFVDPDCPDFNNLVLIGNTVTSKSYAFVFGRNKLIGQSSFTITFTRTVGPVLLGMMDIQNKNKNGNWNYNYVYYWSSNKYNVDGEVKHNQGGGFKIGEPVTLVINLNTGLIQWKVGSEIRYQASYPKLKDKTISWVPYLSLSPNQSFEISE